MGRLPMSYERGFTAPINPGSVSTMNNDTATITTLTGNNVHCSLCGRNDDGAAGEGYSRCCNDRVCYSGGCALVQMDYADGFSETIHFDSRDDAIEFLAEGGIDL